MKWITREKIKVDRVACSWLIKKFVDPRAEFFFGPPAQVATMAREIGAIPFDVEGCELGKHGDLVSFDAILKKYRLDNPALALMAAIVRTADSRQAKPNPAGEGLKWIASGFGALGLSDPEILQCESIVYDALYAECQRQVGAGGA